MGKKVEQLSIFDQSKTVEEELGLTEEEKQQMYRDMYKKEIIVKCKPCYNFQTVEFDYMVSDDSDLDEMMELYNNILQRLMKVAVAQPAPVKMPEKPENPATDAQLKILKQFGIKFKPNISKEEAHTLIKKSYDKTH